jgi:hypothetical protein
MVERVGGDRSRVRSLTNPVTVEPGPFQGRVGFARAVVIVRDGPKESLISMALDRYGFLPRTSRPPIKGCLVF